MKRTVYSKSVGEHRSLRCIKGEVHGKNLEFYHEKIIKGRCIL